MKCARKRNKRTVPVQDIVSFSYSSHISHTSVNMLQRSPWGDSGDPPSSSRILPRISSLHPILPPPHHLPSAHQPPNQSPAPRFESRSRFERHSALKSPGIQEVEAASEVPQKRVGAARQGAGRQRETSSGGRGTGASSSLCPRPLGEWWRS
jgi:hypothetical protein